MPTRISEVMTADPSTCPGTASVVDAARVMKDKNIGDVIVLDSNDQLCGIVTDRDIAVRVVAEGKNPESIRLDEICSKDVTTVAPNDPVREAVQLMRDRAIRRLPVVEDGRPVGIVTIGDLAMEKDSESALAEISAAPPNR